MHKPFTVRWEDVLPGDPQQVWDAITRRCSGWIWEIEYEPRVGGSERGLGGGTVTAWDPPHHLQTLLELPGGGSNRLDYRLEPHAEGTLVRYTHDGVAEEGDYGRTLDECEHHTAFYRHSLTQYVRHFAGREAAYVGIDADATFAEVCRRLGVPQEAAVGDAIRLEPAGVPPIEGTIDYLTPTFLGVRGDDLLFRVYGRDMWNDPLTLALHLFDPAADAPAIESAWNTWMNPTEAVA